MLVLRMRGRAVGFENCSVQTAVARRVVGDLWDMATMCAVPDGVRCVSLGVAASGGVDEVVVLADGEERLE